MKDNTRNTEIIFKNEPKLSEHEADSKFNERRIKLVPKIKDFIANHLIFKDKEVNVTFAHKGVSSLVCIIETSEEKLVLKVHLSTSHSLGEGLFLRVWEEVSVKVPHVIEDGVLDGHAYTLMEFVDAPTLTEAYTQEELIEKRIYFEMGSTLRTMHRPEAEGYGRLIDGKPEFSKFKDWILSHDMKERYQYVQEHKLLSDEHGSLSKAIEVLTEYVGGVKSSYCHDDFGGSNIFATSPITIFDPSPRFNNGYLDLGRSLYNFIAHGVFLEQFIEGYFNGESCDRKVLQASILINSYYKFPYAHKTDRQKIISNVQEYLIKNKHLLD